MILCNIFLYLTWPIHTNKTKFKECDQIKFGQRTLSNSRIRQQRFIWAGQSVEH